MSLKYLTDRGSVGQGIIEPTPCEFCGKIHTTKSSLNNHRRRCPKNPDRQLEKMTEAGKEKSRIA